MAPAFVFNDKIYKSIGKLIQKIEIIWFLALDIMAVSVRVKNRPAFPLDMVGVLVPARKDSVTHEMAMMK